MPRRAPEQARQGEAPEQRQQEQLRSSANNRIGDWLAKSDQVSEAVKGGLKNKLGLESQDSSEYQNILRHVKAMPAKMYTNIGPDNMQQQINILNFAFTELVSGCSLYLEKHQSAWTSNGKSRRRHVQSVKQMTESQLELLHIIPNVMGDNPVSRPLSEWLERAARHSPRPAAIPDTGTSQEDPVNIGAQPKRTLGSARDKAYEEF